MDTSRVDGVKAPLHNGTPRSDPIDCVANLFEKAMSINWTLCLGGDGAARCSDSKRRNFSVVLALWARTAFFCLLKPARSSPNGLKLEKKTTHDLV